MNHLTPERIAELRQMTPEAKWREAERLWWEARRERANSVRRENPDWPEDSVQAEVSRLFLSEALKEC